MTPRGESDRPVSSGRVARLGPNAALARLLALGRLPAPPMAIDGCLELLATPDDSGRHAGLGESDIHCRIVSAHWSPEARLPGAPTALPRFRETLRSWRAQVSAPRPIRTLLHAPRPLVTDHRELRLVLGSSDYFTVRTLTEMMRGPERLEELSPVFPSPIWWARDEHPFPTDSPPYHVSAQAIVVDRDPETGCWSLILTATSPFATPLAGGVSATIAEQMRGDVPPPGFVPWWAESARERSGTVQSPPADAHIVDTLRRGLLEELALRPEDYRPPLLLSACLEAEMLFVTFLFLVRTHLGPRRLHERWIRAPDRQEFATLAGVPLGRGPESGPPPSGLDIVVRLLSAPSVDVAPLALPAPLPASHAREWHPSARMRLFAAASHFWGDAAFDRVKLESVFVAATPTTERPGDASAARRPTRGEPRARDLSIRLVDGIWIVAGCGQTVGIAGALRGLTYLQRLIEAPHQEIHVLDLTGAQDRGDAGTILDAKATREFKARLTDLAAQLDEAEAANDLGRAERLRSEQEALLRELRRATGLGGRKRRDKSQAERARINVQRCIAKVIDEIASKGRHELAKTLREDVRTGFLCVYRPGR